MSTHFDSYQLTEFNSLFEIPIYRLSPASFEKELQEKLDKICHPLTFFEALFPKKAKEKYDTHRREIELHIGYPWKFNEIIGWILLNVDRDLFCGELFLKEGKRIAKGSKSKISYNDEAFRFDITSEMTDKDIYTRILFELDALTKKHPAKGRFIDTNRFKTVGRYISWKQMVADLDD